MKLKRYIDFMNEALDSKWVFEGNFEVTKDMVTDGKFISGKIPDEVNGDFYCYDNQLTSLEGGPIKVGRGFFCYDNQLTTLEGGPIKVGGNFDCNNNQLTSLEGAPVKVGGGFDCSYNRLTSLEGGPEKVSGSFGCSKNQLTSLEGAPAEVGGSFISFDNRFPLEIERDFIKAGRCKNNYGETNGYWMDLLKYMIDEKIDLQEVKGWPEGFLTDEIIRSARGINKYNI